MSLRRRVLVGIVAVAAVLVVTNAVLASTFHSFLLTRVDRQLAAAVESGLQRGGPGGRPRGGFAERLTLDRDLLTEHYVAVLDRTNGRLNANDPLLGDGGSALPAIEPLDLATRAGQSAATATPYTVDAQTGGGSWRMIAVNETPRFVIGVGTDLSSLDATLRRIRLVQASATAAVLFALALVSWWVLRLGVHPVESMAKTADAIAAGDLSHRIAHTDERTEAGRLGVALNTMLERIQQAFEALGQSEAKVRRFAADASHELRTPLTSIQGYAELWRAGGLRSDEELAEAMRRMEQEAKRMGALVEDLLLLARLDQRRPMNHTLVQLDRLVADGVSDARAVEPDRPIELVANGAVSVEGDEGHLRQVVANLLANARVHTPAGTPVRVTVAAVDGRARLEVADQGPGMAPDVAAKVFERFYRADASRVRDKGGSGLGLSIVAAIAEAHGGRASVESTPPRGSRFVIELPLRQATP